MEYNLKHSFYKRGSSDMLYCNFTHKGEPINRSTGKKTEAEANAWCNEQRRLIDERLAKPKRIMPLISEAVEECYEDRVDGWGKKKNREDLRRMALCFIDLFGDIPINEITTEMVKKAKIDLETLKISPKREGLDWSRRPPKTRHEVNTAPGVQQRSSETANRYLAALRRVLNVASEKYKFLPPKFVVEQSKGKLNKFYSQAEEAQILEWFRSHGHDEMADCLMLLFDTGLRLGEAVGIGKKDKDGNWISTYDPYNDIITSYYNKASTVRSAALEGRSAEMARIRGAEGRPMFNFTCEQIENRWVTMRKHLKVSKDWRIHTIRHTCASRLLQSGVDIMTVKEYLGHSSITVTQRYTHTAPDALRKAAQTLQKYTPAASKKEVQNADAAATTMLQEMQEMQAEINRLRRELAQQALVGKASEETPTESAGAPLLRVVGA